MILHPASVLGDRLHQQADGIAARNDCFLNIRFPPACPRVFSQKIAAMTASRTVARSLPVEILGYLDVGFHVAMVEFIPIVLAQRLGIDADHAGYLMLGDAVAGKRFDLSTIAGPGHVGLSRPESALTRHDQFR